MENQFIELEHDELEELYGGSKAIWSRKYNQNIALLDDNEAGILAAKGYKLRRLGTVQRIDPLPDGYGSIKLGVAGTAYQVCDEHGVTFDRLDDAFLRGLIDSDCKMLV